MKNLKYKRKRFFTLVTCVLSIINASVRRREASSVNYDLYGLLRSSDLLPRPRILKLATGTSHFTAITYITTHACRIIPPPCNSKSPSVAHSPREVSAASLVFFFTKHQKCQRNVRTQWIAEKKRMTQDNAISVKKRESTDGNVDL